MTEKNPIGVLLLAYGTPERLEDVEPYYTHIRGGRPPTPEALENLRERYRRVGGRTPLLDLTRATADALQARLDQQAPGSYRVYIAMKHWHPYIAEVLPRMAADGIRVATAIVLAPHYSRMSIGSYRKYAEAAQAQLAAPIALDFVESWQAQPLFRRLIAGRIAEGLAQFPPEARDRVTVLFSAHSLPERILTWDDPYPRELRESAAGVAELAGLRDWRFAYQSAGMTGEPWLGPDILDALEELAGEGVRNVLSVPFGFVAEHLEVLWDIDNEAQARAAELGMTLRRTRMPNADPEFVEVLAAIVRSTVVVGRSSLVVIGTRGSKLALAQTELVSAALLDAHPGLRIAIERITTRGDIVLDRPLNEIGDKGLFVAEIEQALRAGRIDLAVHSAKDLPSELPPDMALAAFPRRADPRDVLITRAGRGLSALPPGARVGTSSLRRACQLHSLRPDLQIVDLRGNVDTRLRKLHEGQYDAIMLAAAGLDRLGIDGLLAERLAPEVMLPAVGQGALAIEVRAGDESCSRLLAPLDDPATRVAVMAERAFLAHINGGCQVPAGAYARLDPSSGSGSGGAALTLTGMIGARDGRLVRGEMTGSADEPAALGARLAEALLDGGGWTLLNNERR